MKIDERDPQQTLKSNQLPVALLHDSGLLLDANQPFCDLLGYTPEEIRDGQVNWRILTVPEFIDQHCRFLGEIKATGFCRPYEEVFQKRDGQPVPAIVGGAVLQNKAGHNLLFALDISSNPESSDMLAKLEYRMLFLSQVISDLEEESVPLARAEDSLRLQSEEFQSLAQQLQLARQREREEMTHLIYDGLRHISLGSSFRSSLMKRRQNVRSASAFAADVVSHGIEASRSLATDLSLSILHEGKLVPTLKRLAQSLRDRYGLKAEFFLNDEIEFAPDDAKLLIVRAIRELLMNVIRHSDVNLVRVSLGISKGDFQIEVEDNGIGFDPNHLEAKTEDGGGLAMLRKDVRKFSGELKVFSAPGLGTRCTIFLPYRSGGERQKTAEHPVVRIPAQAVAADVRRIHVLLVDDHTVIRQAIMGLLKRESDFEIVGEASDGESAVELARAVQPDVVLMDIYMPGIGGVQATKLIHDELPQVRVIGLSMLEEKEMALLMHEAGAVGYLTKNGPSEELISTIRACA